MTNQELNDLTMHALAVRNTLPELLVDGNGNLRLLDGSLLDPLAFIRKLSEARTLADKVYVGLNAMPRRPEKSKAAAPTKPKPKRAPKASKEERDSAIRDWLTDPPKTHEEWLAAPPGTPRPAGLGEQE